MSVADAMGAFSASLRKCYAMTARTSQARNLPNRRKTYQNTAPTVSTHFLPFGRSYFMVDTHYIGVEKFPYHDCPMYERSFLKISQLCHYEDPFTRLFILCNGITTKNKKINIQRLFANMRKILHLVQIAISACQ